MRILSMSGFVPEHICDTVRFTQYAGDRNISHYCGYASDFISQVMQDDTIDGAVFPKSCDSTRVMTSYMSGSGKFLHQINVPSFGAAGAVGFYAESIKSYKTAVEKYYGFSINDVQERTEVINDRNLKAAGIYNALEDISYTDYLSHIHDNLSKPLFAQQWDFDIKPGQNNGKKVFIVGSFLSNSEIPDMIEKLGLTVVGDSLPESGRLASRPMVDLSGGLYEGIARSILSGKRSPTQNSFKDILETDIEEIKKKAVKGVIFIIQKYCEPYEYLYSVYKNELDALGIASVKLSLNDTEDGGKAALAIEAFADTI